MSMVRSVTVLWVVSAVPVFPRSREARRSWRPVSKGIDETHHEAACSDEVAPIAGIIANTIANIISGQYDPAFASVLGAVQLAANFIPIVGPDRLAASGSGNARTHVGAVVGKLRPMTPGEKTGELIWAAAGGVFAYTLFTGTTPFTSKHPVWGTLFAFGAVSRLAGVAAGTAVEEV
mgnify:CR=1 FL=1